MGDPSTQVDKYLVKKTTSYNPEEGTAEPLETRKKRIKSGAYQPRSSEAAKSYKDALDEAGNY